jgi:hypothetical protein
MSTTNQALTSEIQGRRANNGVQPASEQNNIVTLTVAAEMAAEGFTARVFETKKSVGRKQYKLIDTVSP